ncbi:Elongation factor G [bacterium HR36]|nr:Elongation factor G [bacterium HR36]
MAKYTVEDIRNVAFVGHSASGKTSLLDTILFKAKAVDRRGSVDEGTSFCDYDDEEKKRRATIDAKILTLEYRGKKLHLLDTPGYPDFIGQSLCALNAVETAVIVVSAPAGIEVNTRRLYNEAKRLELARLIVINKMDADNIHLEGLIRQIQQTFGKGCVLFQIPIGTGPEFSGVVNLLNPPGQLPPGLALDFQAARSQLIDAIVETDEALMEKYLTEGEVSSEELFRVLPQALASGAVVPILFASAKKDLGVSEAMDALVDIALSPVQARPRIATRMQNGQAETVRLAASESGPLVGQVFKVLNDRFVGILSFIRLFSGRMSSDTPIPNVRTGKSQRSPGLLQVHGKTTKPLAEAIAGDIFAVAKVEDLRIGDTLATDPIQLPLPTFPTPMYGLAIEPKSRGDEQKISQSLAKMAEEDPTFKVTRDPQTRELVVTGVSQLHLDIIQARLKRRFDLEVVTKEPKIPYRETITAQGEGQYRHKKQTGGRGQFGEVHLRVYPLPREITSEEEVRKVFMNKERFPEIREEFCIYNSEYNFAFVDCIVGGVIPNQFMPAVYKGCMEVMEKGALAGYRMQDIGVEIYFGKDHPVDSSEAAFKTAARTAFKMAVLNARPVLLEPIVLLEVTVPSKFTGAILGDLNTRRARIENQDTLPGDLQVIRARVPLAEVTRYAAVLGSITQGQGSYTMEFSHYDQVPAHIQQQIIAKAAKAAEEEEEE